jgi:hypothetical protein
MSRRDAARQRIGIGGAMALAFAACQVTVPAPSDTVTPTASAIPTVAAVPSPSGLTPTATEALAELQLPGPGGTCRSSQFVAGTATSQYDFSTLFSRVADASQPLTNIGDDCVLAVPKTIAMAGEPGPFVAIDLANAGQQVCTNSDCEFVYPQSYEVPAGQSIRIDLRAWWPSDPAAVPSPRPMCAQPITDVTHAEFPFASGVIQFTWDTPFHEVCPSAARIAITVGGAPAAAELPVVCTPWPIHHGMFISTLTCEAALNAALGALPSEHSTITSIVVQLGRYCPTIATCPSDLNLVTGYVTMTLERDAAVLVTVRGEPNTPVVVTEIGPLPTAPPGT